MKDALLETGQQGPGASSKFFDYARAPSLEKVISVGADFIVRTDWTIIRLLALDRQLVDWDAILNPMQPDGVRAIDDRAEFRAAN
ncbi:hypothetical protein ACD578_29705 (plasmid) [Microvirga sp. RSM25]|uniref:hypothetical protein n=1 Tax=Microvirga sp. RSM25 TaxID=3273802 RepID=UPI00384E1B73